MDVSVQNIYSSYGLKKEKTEMSEEIPPFCDCSVPLKFRQKSKNQCCLVTDSFIYESEGVESHSGSLSGRKYHYAFQSASQQHLE